MGSFGRRLSRALGSVVGLSVIGCAGNAEDARTGYEPARTRDDLTNNYCDDTGGTRLVAHFSPATPQDYIAHRYMNYLLADRQQELHDALPPEEELAGLSAEEREAVLSEIYQGFVTTAAEVGICDPHSGCTKNQLPPNDGFPMSGSGNHHYLAFGLGVTTFVTNAEELRAFFGEIDTPAEAFALALSEGHQMNCSANNYRAVDDGFELYTEAGNPCIDGVTSHILLVTTDGSIEERASEMLPVDTDSCTVIGRFPSGKLQMQPATAAHPIAAYFAHQGQLEASSVLAFEEIARDLKTHGAPARLIEWALSAAREEANHARLCFELCRRYGGNPIAPTVERGKVQTLLDMALDNAVEGLTREAFGALLGHHQALRAEDPAIARAMRLIADDETRHAEFSIELHDWIMTQLTDGERNQVIAARAAALLRFEKSAHPKYDDELTKAAGLPEVDVSRKLFAELFREELAERDAPTPRS